MGASLRILRVVIVGPIASGKGTISKHILQEFPNFVHISPGDLMRQEVQNNTPLGQQVKMYVANGVLVPDELIVDSVFKELEKSSRKNWILDGFPRTINQAQLLHGIESYMETDESGDTSLYDTRGLAKNPIDAVLNLIVPDEVVIERTSNRWTHLPSGRIYSAGFHEPRVKWKDDETGEDLVQRVDDKPAVVAERLKIYKNITKPVLNFYRYHGIEVLDICNDSTSDVWPFVKNYLYEQFEKCNKN